MTVSDLSVIERIQLIERERLDALVAELDLQQSAEIVTPAQVTGQRESLFDLQQRLADQLIEGFEIVLTADAGRRLENEARSRTGGLLGRRARPGLDHARLR